MKLICDFKGICGSTFLFRSNLINQSASAAAESRSKPFSPLTSPVSIAIVGCRVRVAPPLHVLESESSRIRATRLLLQPISWTSSQRDTRSRREGGGRRQRAAGQTRPHPASAQGGRTMSFSPKHSTPFSVTDILSPMEDSYRRFGGMDPAAGSLGSQLGAYRQPQVSQPGMQHQQQAQQQQPPHLHHHHHHHHHHHLSSNSSSSSSSSSSVSATAAAAALGPGGPYHVPHGVPQFSGAVGGFCNGGIGNVGDLPSYQETVRSGGAAAAAWYSNPEPRYPTSKTSLY